MDNCLTRVDAQGVPCIVQRFWFTTEMGTNILHMTFFDGKELELCVEPSVTEFNHHTIEAIGELAWHRRHFGRKYVIRA